MKKVLFILQKKYYNKNYIIYMRMLKIIGYKVDVITDMEEKIKYCDYQLKNRLSIFKQINILKNNYQMIFCDSKILEILLKLFNLKEKNKIIYIKNKTKMLDNKKEDSYDEVNIINEKYTFCSIGEFNKSNNQIMQLESMIRIIKKYPQIKLLLIGQGNLKEYYEHIIEKYGLSNNVEIIENINSIVQIIKKVDCIISTRKKEEFSLDTIIAILLKKPIIVSNVGINRIIFKSKNIFYNSNDLKEKMKINIEENRKIEQYYNIKKQEIEKILKSESI